jgi:cardiolipin synthase (CMP-forming)
MVNIPNILSAFRLVGSFVLVGLAVAEHRTAFVALLMALLVSDWVDGKLAIAWRLQTTFGARLDSLADACMYAAMLFGFFRLHSEFVIRDWPWMAAVVASYAVSLLFGRWKFGKFPSYHTRAAKTGWLAVSLGAVALFAATWYWPLKVAALWVVLTNVEAVAITCVLDRWVANVPSLWHAWQLRKAGPDGDSLPPQVGTVQRDRGGEIVAKG